MSVLGIDFSVTCPALCYISGGDSRWWVNYKLHGHPFVDIPDIVWTPSTIDGDLPRFLELSQWVVDVVKQTTPTLIVLEDYAFAAAGRITQLAENGGILKAALHHAGYEVRVVAPTTMKKFATGNGRADKDMVWAAFVEKEPQAAGWQKLCHPKAVKVGSPMADVADSYFLAQYGAAHYVS